MAGIVDWGGGLQHLESDVSRNLILSALASTLLLAIGLNNWAALLASFVFTGLVVTMVLGIYGFLGWNLDLIAAVSLVMVVPLVSDYLGRLVYLYVACHGSTREARVLYALAAAGEPVFTSASCAQARHDLPTQRRRRNTSRTSALCRRVRGSACSDMGLCGGRLLRLPCAWAVVSGGWGCACSLSTPQPLCPLFGNGCSLGSR